jgi:hypothetical protein
MENHLTELCPICIEKPAEYYTECGHNYCIGCLSRIKKCAMCRKPLMRANLCVEIKSKNKSVVKLSGPTGETGPTYMSSYYNILRISSGMGGLDYSS